MITIQNLFENENYPPIELLDIMDDSRIETLNSVFFSLQGLTHDGHSFINQAIDNGAICIVHSRELKNKREGIFYVFDPELNENYANYVSRFFDNPSSKLHLIGITGTNGKTTIASLIQTLMDHFKKSAYMGTLGFYYKDHQLPSRLTTSTLVDNQKYLSLFVKEGIKVCAMEASSQGIDLGRLDGLQFETAIFTNLSQDHLDYHLNMESYYQAKKRLFSKLEFSKKVIINIDDAYGLRLSKELVNPVITISMNNPDSDVFIHDIVMSFEKTDFKLKYENTIYEFTTNLLGRYNLMNLVQAMMAIVLEGIRFEELSSLLNQIDVIEGRLQLLKGPHNISVIVDFAHSPDSMEKILEFAQNVIKNKGRIISVFGSAGQRDKSKRIIMGEVADKYSDLIYLTQDDPRDEKVLSITQEIAQGILNNPYVEIEDREQAIHFAIHSARSDDIIIIMGKGPETTMAIGTQDIPYKGDYQIAQENINSIKGEIDEKFE